MKCIYPLMMAVCKGHQDIMELILRNPTLDINRIDPKTGINSFWLACFFGHGSFMKKLAEKGSNIMITNRENINVLHLAIYKN
jgi:ankyrin repeat protein